MPPDSALADVAHVIQLAIAPVFLLTAVSTILGVLNTRLARIVDRARVVHERLAKRGAPLAEEEVLRKELRSLARRRHLVNRAITSGVTAALVVCLLIATAFAGSILRVNLWVVVALLFVLALAAVVLALVSFLREIFLAVATIEYGEG